MNFWFKKEECGFCFLFLTFLAVQSALWVLPATTDDHELSGDEQCYSARACLCGDGSVFCSCMLFVGSTKSAYSRNSAYPNLARKHFPRGVSLFQW
uniref:Ubiquitin-conjugating enzyme family protein n=1 Tax=Rhizophora mucronata TaxID=61149 RepID=A0A2P2LTZ5_RHIMU